MAQNKKGKVTPLMKQYFELKAKHKDALLLFRVGDFYETFGEDAIKASAVLGIVLTARNNGGSQVELAGFPYHSLDVYLPRLVKAGFRVAICEQLEKPSKDKKIVKRGVTDVITPGIGTDDNLLNQKENNYLSAITFGPSSQVACAFLDLSTGDFSLYEGNEAQVAKLISTYEPKEILYAKQNKQLIEDLIGTDFYTYGIEDWIWQEDYCRDKILELFKVKNLKGYGIESCVLGQIAAGAILHYLDSSEQKNVSHINKISRILLDNYVWLDQFTIRNLELLHSNHPGGIPLYQILDRSVTAMGGRLLKKWLMLPLTDIPSINRRLSIVECLITEEDLADHIDTNLKKISDLERIIAKVALRKVNPREVDQLKNSLLKIPSLQEKLASEGHEGLNALVSGLDPATDLCTHIEKSIKSEPPVNLAKGNVIADGWNEELDHLRGLINNSKGHLQKLLDEETEATGIGSLKVGFNNVFGYYFEVTNKYKGQDLIPDTWTRKQTLTNAERYISEDLKKLESSILGAEEKILVIEVRLYEELIDFISNYIETIQKDANILAQLDCLNSFAKLSKHNKYCKPEINDSLEIIIKQGRHPVIEAHLPLGESYIPNDLHINNDKDQILLITGPNMSGKSAILRQTALICMMAQIGCFVPAEKASIGIVDRIFTRVGASDNISSGESTFMVEMIETSSILNNLSPRSLILLDEIGRGTSTYDGISIAWSIVEYLHENAAMPKTLFATHYHELSQLADKFERISNHNVATKELGEKILFLRKLVKGSSNQSFGIQVAQMAGMPKGIVQRAKHILSSLQGNSVEADNRKKTTLQELEEPVNGQLLMFAPDPAFEEVTKQLKNIDINTMTPIECMMKLKSLVKKIQR
ncbi:MAG: DNA mismatch repair protein MutS [Saprospiraceae bacterium]